MEPLTSNRSHTLNVEEAHRALVGVSSGLTRLWRVPRVTEDVWGYWCAA